MTEPTSPSGWRAALLMVAALALLSAAAQAAEPPADWTDGERRAFEMFGGFKDEPEGPYLWVEMYEIARDGGDALDVRARLFPRGGLPPGEYGLHTVGSLLVKLELEGPCGKRAVVESTLPRDAYIEVGATGVTLMPGGGYLSGGAPYMRLRWKDWGPPRIPDRTRFEYDLDGTIALMDWDVGPLRFPVRGHGVLVYRDPSLWGRLGPGWATVSCLLTGMLIAAVGWCLLSVLRLRRLGSTEPTSGGIQDGRDDPLLYKLMEARGLLASIAAGCAIGFVLLVLLYLLS
ncbi:MAG: hypothetical protein R6V05_01240 [Candidatus Brocadiia bacterium]